MKALGTFKLEAVGHTVFPKQVDNKFVISYNTHLLDIVEHTVISSGRKTDVPKAWSRQCVQQYLEFGNIDS